MIGNRLPRAPAGKICVIDGDTWNRVMDRLERLERFAVAAPLMLDDNGNGRVLRVKYPPPGFDLKWGKLTADWIPGYNSVTLTPCVNGVDDTATGADDVQPFVQYPINTGQPALCFGASPGAILPYYKLPFTNVAGDTLYVLFDPPVLPRPSHLGDVLTNTTDDAVDHPHLQFQYVEAHP